MRFTRFRAVLPLLALGLAASCSYLIPEDESEPRYNSVMGGRRMPQENASSMAGDQGAPVEAIQSSSNMPNLPPVSASTMAEANARMASSRSVPVENEYPELSAIPPAPAASGAGSTADRLAQVRAELERDRVQAGMARSQLAADAAAEPSMLSNLPPSGGTAPAPMPVVAAPLPAPAPAPMPVAVVPVATPTPAPMIALPPPMPVYAAPAPINMDAAPMAAAPVAAAPAMEPIMLRPPVGAAPAPAPAFVPTPAPTYAPQPMAPAMSGGFDPMAGTVTTGTRGYSSTGYLPPSRYTGRR